MKLPFRQLPELPAGHGMVVGAPPSGGRTFFLTRMADFALREGIDVAYFAVDSGLNYFNVELCQADHKKLTFVDLHDAAITIETWGKALDAGLRAGLCIVDDWTTFVFRATHSRQLLNELGIDERQTPPPLAYLTETLMTALKLVKKRGNMFMFGASHRRAEPPIVPADCDPLVWEARMKCFPIPYTPPPSTFGAIKLPDNLLVVNLLRTVP